jgi:valyl-tRNA synthetase
MILSTTYSTGQVPFRTVYLHGLILDENGDKMSKSNPETCIDPLDTIAEYGADVLRLALVIGNSAGRDIKLSKERISGCWRLQNKLWNAGKLVLRIASEAGPAQGIPEPEHAVNRWQMARLDALVSGVNDRLDSFAFGVAAEMIQSSFWSEFCDFYLEAIKTEDLAHLPETAQVAQHAFRTYLLLFHPFIPFITEALWSEVGGEGQLAVAAWPKAGAQAIETEGVDALVRLVGALRGLRAEQDIDPGSKVRVKVRPIRYSEDLEACAPVIARLVRTEALDFVDEDLSAAGGSTVLDKDFEALIELNRTDQDRERARLEKQEAKAAKRLESLEANLGNEKFLQKATAEAVDRTRKEADELRENLASFRARLGSLG